MKSHYLVGALLLQLCSATMFRNCPKETKEVTIQTPEFSQALSTCAQEQLKSNQQVQAALTKEAERHKAELQRLQGLQGFEKFVQTGVENRKHAAIVAEAVVAEGKPALKCILEKLPSTTKYPTCDRRICNYGRAWVHQSCAKYYQYCCGRF